jgi:hypothetical protein
MSATWMKHALVGVQDPAPLPADGELGALLATIAAGETDAALAFSRAMGALAACRLAAVVLDEAEIALPSPAEHDARALAGTHAWSSALGSTFSAGPLRLQYEACQRIAAAGATLPHSVLPDALDAGRRSVVLRTVLRPVLGLRGFWLSQFNPEWTFAGGLASDDGSDARQWDEGNSTQRAAYLRGLRARDPSRARSLLAERLGELPAKERLELVEVLDVGLEAADEAMLEPLLKDRSKDVRQTAAGLLARLPGSAHAQRLVGWLAPLLTVKRGLLGGKSWLIEAPAAADPAWAGAAIETTRPQHDALGERAWGLYQLARQAPLAWWATHTGLSPADLVAWAGKSDWHAALQRGWVERVGAADIDWIEAMLEAKSREFAQERARLLGLLTVERREKHWPRAFDKLRAGTMFYDVVAACAPGETLSRDYSRALLPGLLAFIAGDGLRHDFQLRAHVLELATMLHPDSLHDWHAPPRRGDETPALAECLDDLARVVATRRALNSSLT